MNKIVVLFLIVCGMVGCSIQSKRKCCALPKGYREVERVQGDLNGDEIDDYVLIIKGTNKEKVVENRFGNEVDLNRRGILVYLSNANQHYLKTQNLNCFSSESEDGGVYFPPVLSVNIKKGELCLHYDHGRYGYWVYVFKNKTSDFELIAYNSSENYGPIVRKIVNIDFIGQKKLIRENLNQDSEDSSEEVFKDVWEDIAVEELYELSEIKDFDELKVK